MLRGDGSDAPDTPVYHRRDGTVADRRRVFDAFGRERASAGRLRCRRYLGAASADSAVEGCAAARHCRLGEIDRRRTVADRAERQRRRQGERDPGGPPYVWFAEVASPAAGTWHATLTRVALRCSTITRDIVVRDAPEAAAWRTPERGLADARRLEPLDRKSVLGVDRENVRRAARCRAVVGEPAHDVLRDKSRNMLFNYLGTRRGRNRHADQPRLRRSGLFPARLFRVQDGPAVRLLELLARRRRQAAEMRAGHISG